MRLRNSAIARLAAISGSASPRCLAWSKAAESWRSCSNNSGSWSRWGASSIHLHDIVGRIGCRLVGDRLHHLLLAFEVESHHPFDGSAVLEHLQAVPHPRGLCRDLLADTLLRHGTGGDRHLVEIFFDAVEAVNEFLADQLAGAFVGAFLVQLHDQGADQPVQFNDENATNQEYRDQPENAPGGTLRGVLGQFAGRAAGDIAGKPVKCLWHGGYKPGRCGQGRCTRLRVSSAQRIDRDFSGLNTVFQSFRYTWAVSGQPHRHCR